MAKRRQKKRRYQTRGRKGSFQACMKRKLKGKKGGKAAFRRAAKACKIR